MGAILQGDSLEVLRTLPDCSVHCCVTSPPYWGLRDYGVSGQLGLEATPQEYVSKMVDVFREVRRVLRDDGTLWLNLGDSYAGSGKGAWGNSEQRTLHKGEAKETYIPTREEIPMAGKTPLGFKPKDLVGIPWRVALALQDDGWYLRQDIIWHKPNPMPESVTDRCTKAHEYIFLMAKSARYYYDHEAVKEEAVYGGYKDSEAYNGKYGAGENVKWEGKGTPNRNRRSVWTVATHSFSGAHFATFPPDLIKPCILAGCPEGGIVLDPFFGSGTTGVVATQLGREYMGIELNPEYVAMARNRIKREGDLTLTLFVERLGVS